MSEETHAPSSSTGSLDLLYHVSRELASTLELNTVLKRVLELSKDYVGAESGTLIVLDNKGKALDSIIFIKDKLIHETTEQLGFTLKSGLAGWVVENREAVLISDTSKDSRWKKGNESSGQPYKPKSSVSAPLIQGKELVGVLTLTNPKANYFNENHLELVEAIASQAAIAVSNGRLYEESQRRAQAMGAIATSAETITASLELDEVLQTILAETTNALNVEAVSLALLDDSGQNIVFKAATGKKSQNIIGLSIELGQGIAGWVAKSGEAIIVDNAHDDPRFYASVDQNTGFRTEAIACAPIRSLKNIVGVLEAINPIGRSFREEDLTVLQGIGNLAGAAIERAQIFQQVQQARSRYLELFEDSVNPIFVTDMQGKISEANFQARELTGFTNEQLQEMNIHHFHQADWKALGSELANLKSGNIVSYESSLLGSQTNGVNVEVHVRSIEVDGSEQVQWILRDVTERHNLDTLREDLASMIYHDLRSPLANVVSGLDVLEMMLPDDDPTVRTVLDIAVRSTERVQRLATSLLDTSRMEAGQTVGKPEPYAFAELASEALDANQPFAEAKGVRLTSAVPKKLPKVLVDGEMIKRVMINLIENALKYSDEDQEVSLGAKRDGQKVRVWIADEGRGIPEKEQERIFEKFARVRKTTTGNTAGLGLGLAYCKLAIEGHGGKIWVESEKGKGAKFIFTIPTV